MNFEHDVFISHTEDGRELGHQIYRLLNDQFHLRCYFSPVTSQTTGQINTNNDDALAGSRCVLFVLTPAFKDSEPCQSEVQRAATRQPGQVQPIVVRSEFDVDVPMRLGDPPVIDVPDGRSDWQTKLLQAIHDRGLLTRKVRDERPEFQRESAFDERLSAIDALTSPQGNRERFDVFVDLSFGQSYVYAQGERIPMALRRAWLGVDHSNCSVVRGAPRGAWAHVEPQGGLWRVDLDPPAHQHTQIEGTEPLMQFEGSNPDCDSEVTVTVSCEPFDVDFQIPDHAEENLNRDAMEKVLLTKYLKGTARQESDIRGDRLLLTSGTLRWVV